MRVRALAQPTRPDQGRQRAATAAVLRPEGVALTVAVRVARRDEIDAACTAYAAWGYTGGILGTDTLYFAERDGALAGIVRRTVEHGHTMLRGMWIDPRVRRCGIGTRLLRVFDRDLAGRPCLCVPFTHLTGFYGQIGFAPLAEALAPPFLVERLAAYRASGRDMLIMRRESR